jgi:phosphatidylglycerophosphate synthase
MKTIDLAERAPKPALIALLFIALLAGAMNGFTASHHAAQPLVWTLAIELVFSFLCFAWYCRDGDGRSFIRSRWLNIAMVTFTMLAIPYYLWRSRPRGQRWRALLRYVGFGVLLGIVTGIGFVLGVLLG